MVRLRVPRAAAWLAIPLAAVAAVALGQLVFRPELNVEANTFEELLEAAPVQQPRFLRLQLLDADGEPAAGAVAVLLEPELALDYADDAGQVALAHFVGGPVRLQAYLPGHALLTRGPVPETELGETLRFAARQQPELPELADEELVQHELVLTDARGEALPGLMVVARHPEGRRIDARPELAPGQEPSRYPVPWIALADEGGRASLDGVPRVPLALQVYPAALPPEPAWLLAERSLLPEADGQTTWSLGHAALTLHGLPPGGLLRGARRDVAGALPLQRVPASGTLEWPRLPPGEYRFQVAGRSFDLQVRQGTQSARFPAAESSSR